MKKDYSPLKVLGLFYLFSVLGAGVIGILTIFYFLSSIGESQEVTVINAILYSFGYAAFLYYLIPLYLVIFLAVNCICISLFIYKMLSNKNKDTE